VSRTRVVVITKAPVAGRSKTRLTPPCTPEQAAGIAAAAVGDTLDVVRAAPLADRVVALDGSPDDLDLDGFTVVPQVEGDLGLRLAAAFAEAMADGPAPTLLIGMDTPQLTAGLLAECAELLETAGPGTAVLGTAPDGGWWALGLHTAEPAAVLAEVPMSRADTAVRTRTALEATGLTVLELPELTDIDHFADALSVARACAPHSRTSRVVASVATALGLA
jgi:uncharacterized protein